MSVSGLVITLSGDARLAEQALRSLAREPSIDFGRRLDRRLPVTADTPSLQEDRRLCDWIRDLDGVEHLDVVFVQVDDAMPLPSGRAIDATPAQTTACRSER